MDVRRWLLAAAEGPAIVVRQIFAGRPVARIERAWAPGLSALEAVTAIRFDPDGRLTFTWLAGPDRRPVTERITVPSAALPGSSAEEPGAEKGSVDRRGAARGRC